MSSSSRSGGSRFIRFLGEVGGEALGDMFDEGVDEVSQFLDGPSRRRSTERDNNSRPSESRDREPAIDDVRGKQ